MNKAWIILVLWYTTSLRCMVDSMKNDQFDIVIDDKGIHAEIKK